MPFPTSKMPPSGSDPVKYLSQDPQGSEDESMDDPVYSAVHALVIKYGQDAVQAALAKCSGDEQVEQTPEAPAAEAME